MEGRRQMVWGPRDPRNDTEVHALGFLFASLSQIRDWRRRNLEMPVGTHRNIPKEEPALSSQRAREGTAWEDRELLDNNHPTPPRHHRKHAAPPPTQPPCQLRGTPASFPGRSGMELGLSPPPSCNKASPSPSWGSVKGGQVGS